jgi:hypothetical protein
MTYQQVRNILFCAAIIVGAGCKKNYIIGGAVQNVNANKDLTTYQVLAQNPLYDTVVQLIDTAGLQDSINTPNYTFFAPSDYAVRSYLEMRTLQVQATIDANAQFGLDSLFYYLRNNINGTRDSFLMYIVRQPLPYSALTVEGAVYQTALPGDSVIVSYEYVETTDQNQGYNPVVNNIPQVVYFTQLWYPFTISPSTPAGTITSDIGVHDLVQSSGIITKTGYIEALDNANPLFFYGTKQ